MSSSSVYPDPPWAGIPPSSEEGEWALVEIKSGVPVARHNLSVRACTLLGRDADACHIVLQHDSCSRLHARIAFDASTTGAASGTPWLRDLQSTHGTKVNKKPVPVQSTGKTESMSTKPGSRGVVIYPSDILQFGASTRIYVVEGPESFGRKVVLPMTKSKTTLSSSSSPPRPVATLMDDNEDETSDNKVAWAGGMNMEDDDDEADAAAAAAAETMKLPSNLSEQDIPERLHKDWNALRAAQYKLEHIQEESERIKRKGSLSEGQEKQLEKNEGRLATLREDVEAKETALFRKLYPEKIRQKRQREEEKSAFFDTENDVEDRTRDRKNSTTIIGEEESEETLLRKRQTILESWRQVQAALKEQSAICHAFQDQIQAMKANGDEEEIFFVQNDLDMARDVLQKHEAKLQEIVNQLQEVDKLLKMINPKCVLEEPSLQQEESVTAEEEIEKEDSGFFLPEPISRSTVSAAVAPTNDDGDEFPLPPPILPPPTAKTSSSLEPDMPPPPNSSNKAIFPPPPVPQKRQRVQGATMPPPGFAAPSSEWTAAPPTAPSTSLQPTSSVQHGVKKKAAAVAGEVDHDKWQPPKDQDGSGYTRLNAKFEGRY